MDRANHRNRTVLEDQIANTLMPSLINHSTNVKSINGMVDALKKTIEEIIRMTNELKSKDNAVASTVGIDSNVLQHISKMTDILKNMEESFKWQGDSLLITHENMLKQIEACFSTFDVKLYLDKQRWNCQNPSSEKKVGENNAKEKKTERSSDANDIDTNKIRQLKEDADKAQKRIQALEEEKGKLSVEIQYLRTDAGRISSRSKSRESKVQVASSIQLFYQRKGGLIDSVEKELTSILKGYLHSIHFERCDKIGDINPSKILLVLCINASRLGTEAANAIEGIKRPENTVLLVFHYKDVHALTKLDTTSSEKCLTAQCFKELGGIFDLAFQSDKGIYQCKMNDNAICEVVSFIRLHTGMK